jgi:hypothetical protein
MENYRTSSHSRHDIKYHFVWITKYRKPILTESVGYRLRELIREIQPAFWTAILQISDRTDHVKDETAWSFYMRGEAGFSIFEEKYPTIWLSLQNKEILTEVFVYDKDGNISEFVPIVVQDNNVTLAQDNFLKNE